ncbi:unnamed protein product [Didymodactylos carnosus]|uniref:AB hydrolase-1 domain-containing protein n=1 Tax=Didymodactylos carnosus TaxID=1234261 RepID=A0A8S2EID5_9BILA|nr:unnamed protein product [Didymodactylos carnosus]CAF3967399.1 unnamed protein product [Didymodactylos carnosus]
MFCSLILPNFRGTFKFIQRTITSHATVRTPEQHTITLNNRPINESGLLGSIQLNVWEWPGKSPLILICHGTSNHGRCFDQIIANLPSDQHIITFDFRGHGYSSQSPPYTFRTISDDLTEFIEVRGIKNAIGIGHSLGGTALILATILKPTAFSNLLLLEPAIFPKSVLDGKTPLQQISFDNIKQRRISTWRSIDEMYDFFKDKPIFRNWIPSTLRDYCTYGVLTGGSGVVLSCDVETSQSFYVSAMDKEINIYDKLCQIEIPVHIVRSGFSYKPGRWDTSFTSPDLVSYFKNAQDTKLENMSHFIPMEAPSLVADLIKQILIKQKCKL